MEKKKFIKVGITIGDINGVGLEVIIKALADSNVYANSIPIIYGSSKAVSFHKKALDQNDFKYLVIKDASEAKPKKVNLINCWPEEVKVVLGEKNANGGNYALKSLEAATSDLQQNKIDTLVTAPINKDCVRDAGFEFPGHTEYLANISNSEDVLMFMVADALRVGVVTGHVPLKDVTKLITKEAVENKLNLMIKSLKRDFLIQKPKIAVLGLNPHAGDRGTIGAEELEIINPVIQKFRDQGELVYGSYSSDGFFGSSNIAGKGVASERSFRNAYFLACDVYERRLKYEELHKNPLQKQTTKKDK